MVKSKWVLVTGTVQYTYSRILVTGFAFIGKVASFLLKQYDIGEGNISQLLQEITAWYFDLRKLLPTINKKLQVYLLSFVMIETKKGTCTC